MFNLLRTIAAVAMAAAIVLPVSGASPGSASSSPSERAAVAATTATPTLVAATAPTPTLAAEAPRCPATVLTAPPSGIGLQGVLLDTTTSTNSGAVATLYRIAANAAIDAAARDRLGIVILTFQAASSSARLVYAGSFAGGNGNNVLDLAARNRTLCQARRAVGQALAVRRTRVSTGSDVAGGLGAGIGYLRSAVVARKPARLLALTDGHTAPGARGMARQLVDLRRALTRMTVEQVLRRYPQQFRLPSARGIAITIKGIDRQSDVSRASTTRARALTRLWTIVCRRAQASCLVTPEVL